MNTVLKIFPLFFLPILLMAKPEKIALQEIDGVENKEGAWIHLHRPAKPNGAAAIICPGGGYGGLSWEPRDMALLNGSTAMVSPAWSSNTVCPRVVPLFLSRMLQRAIRLARHRAKEWKINANKVGIVGFSAGGHLASTAATHFPKSGGPPAKNLFDRISCRPDFAILVYPVVTMGKHTHRGSKRNLLGNNPDPQMVDLFSNEKQVTKETPPVFMAHAVDDRPVPTENSRMLYAALQKKDIPSEYMELPDGGQRTEWIQRPELGCLAKGSIQWLKEIGMLGK